MPATKTEAIAAATRSPEYSLVIYPELISGQGLGQVPRDQGRHDGVDGVARDAVGRPPAAAAGHRPVAAAAADGAAAALQVVRDPGQDPGAVDDDGGVGRHQDKKWKTQKMKKIFFCLFLLRLSLIRFFSGFLIPASSWLAKESFVGKRETR